MIPSLSLALLAYNEEDNIRQCIENADSSAKKYASKYEILVILYEGSTDKTGWIVKGMARKNKKIRLVYQKKEDKGYGAAISAAVKSFRMEYLFYTDADNQFDCTEIKKFLPYIKKYPVITGYKIKRKDPYMRIFTALVYNTLLRIVLGLKVRDIDCAFKLFHRRVFDKVSIEIKSGMGVAEMLAKSEIAGFNIKEIPVTHYPRLKGQPVFEGPFAGMVSIKVVANLLRDLMKLRKSLKYIKHNH